VRESRRLRGQNIGRPMVLDTSETALVQRMRAGGESASTIALTLEVGGTRQGLACGFTVAGRL